ncbi:membrane bound O-acyl transferase MBOAT family protein [Methylobacterium sp. 4-46]|uniref:MBOAT family O-acyltransferase n=1 Tax=unclassified Methylobacterium TaxID=2615210 RepID=UPI000165C577|nr:MULTISPECIES: MBOAT family O-acyltransferase [Methylobacterium]ACA15166.1 membrane bound O-acyl transferase MBOAT family protein [Methylobacterium sp. 4-46]WFT80900.1 MBOAT family O-acyltransferase [Methylobacterium nodulans]
MPFNALTFLLVALPLALALQALCLAWRPAWHARLLAGLSLAYYGWWDLRALPLLLGAIAGTWLAGEAYRRSGDGRVITLALVLDVALLGLFKYLGFFAGLGAALTGAAVPVPLLLAPLGLSFLTFQHVAYLVDLRRGTGPALGPTDYVLYAAFFPRVIAGPLVRPAAFAAAPPRPGAESAARGLLLLAAGLAKKAALGDPLAAAIDPLWAAAGAGLGPEAAAQAVLGYALQLYVDFSGYTDMALGLALLFGIVLPENFRAPYRATSIQDFWRRWHITLSQFLRDYLYIPFGGSRHGLPRQAAALLATMTLGGLWHGAGLTFVAWGAAHGAALALHVLWRRAGLALPPLAGWAATFAFVALAWVPFRAPDFATALAVYRGLAGLAEPAAGLAAPAAGLAAPAAGPVPEAWPLAALAFALAVIGPTAHDLAHRLPLSGRVAAATALLLAALLVQVGNDANQAFIYAQF